MNARERAFRFVRGEAVDRIPVHPLVMQYAAQKSGVAFGDYCLDYRKQYQAMMTFSETYGLECVHPAGFPYCEAGAYGMQIEYPAQGMPYPVRPLITDIETELKQIRLLDLEKDRAIMNRVEGVAQYSQTADAFFYGHCEGPFAEYIDLRGMAEGFTDLYDYENEVHQALRIITENTKQFIRLQVQAGATCISIGDAVCSQIGLEKYQRFVWPLHRELFETIHACGAIAKIHICGNITPLLPALIEAGANIIDIDWMVDYCPAMPLLKPGQVFCGNIDPVAVLYNGTPELVWQKVREYVGNTNSRCIIGSGCEVPPNTPEENYRALVEATKHL